MSWMNPKNRDGHVFHFVRSSFVNDPFRFFFQSFKKFDFVRSQNYCSFSIDFVRFLTERSFSKFVRSVINTIFFKYLLKFHSFSKKTILFKKFYSIIVCLDYSLIPIYFRKFVCSVKKLSFS